MVTGSFMGNVIGYPIVVAYVSLSNEELGFSIPGALFSAILAAIAYVHTFYLLTVKPTLEEDGSTVSTKKKKKKKNKVRNGETTTNGPSFKKSMINAKVQAKSLFSATWGRYFGLNGKYFYHRILITEIIELVIQGFALQSMRAQMSSVTYVIGLTMMILNLIFTLNLVFYGYDIGDLERDQFARKMNVVVELFMDLFYLSYNIYILSFKSLRSYQIGKKLSSS